MISCKNYKFFLIDCLSASMSLLVETFNAANSFTTIPRQSLYHLAFIVLFTYTTLNNTNPYFWFFELERAAWGGCLYVILHCHWTDKTVAVCSIQSQCRITWQHPSHACLSHSIHQPARFVYYSYKSFEQNAKHNIYFLHFTYFFQIFL